MQCFTVVVEIVSPTFSNIYGILMTSLIRNIYEKVIEIALKCNNPLRVAMQFQYKNLYEKSLGGGTTRI